MSANWKRVPLAIVAQIIASKIRYRQMYVSTDRNKEWHISRRFFIPASFCLALAHLSNLLLSTHCGCDIQGKKLNYLFYMDDLKVFGRDNQQQGRLFQTVKKVSDDINMNLDKRNVAQQNLNEVN